MSFIVQKSLGNNFFRFAVGRRRDARSIDENPELSTGSNGEFIRHRPEIFYAADVRTIRSPEVPPPRSIATQPFWSTMVDGTRRGYIMLGLIALGALLLLLGLAVVSSKGAAGVFWIILGLVLIAIPFVITLQKRRVVRAHDTRIRKEREERDARNRELLSAYTAALEKLRDDPSDEVLAYVQRENEKLDLPYAIWADTAIGTVLCIAAFILFIHGWYWTGVAAGFGFMVLDTVDGKLARCTGQSSFWGNIFDHGLDLVHPPFWWWAWAEGLEAYGRPFERVYELMIVGAIVFGYVAHRQIDESGGQQKGRGMATAGIILGWIGLALITIAIVVLISLSSSSSSDY